MLPLVVIGADEQVQVRLTDARTEHVALGLLTQDDRLIFEPDRETLMFNMDSHEIDTDRAGQWRMNIGYGPLAYPYACSGQLAPIPVTGWPMILGVDLSGPMAQTAGAPVRVQGGTLAQAHTTMPAQAASMLRVNFLVDVNGSKDGEPVMNWLFKQLTERPER